MGSRHLRYNLVLIGFSYIAIIAISIQKTTAPYGIAMLYATIVTIILNIIFIPRYGKEGSALATIFAQVLVPAYLFYIGQKIYPIRYKFVEVITVTISLLRVVIAVRFIEFDNLTTQITVKVLVALILVTITLLLNRKSLLPLLEGKTKNR